VEDELMMAGADAIEAGSPSVSLSILYLGPISGTCLDRANAFRRLGHAVEQIDLRQLLPKSVWIDRIVWRLGGTQLSRLLISPLKEKLAGKRYDICYVDGGEWVSPRVIGLLRKYVEKVINYNIDDPLGERDGNRFQAYRQSLPFYDLVVVMRDINVIEAKALGATRAIQVSRSADEISHAPRLLNEYDHQAWDADVLFLGTWFPERGGFLLELIKQGVPLSIRGPNWHKAPEWPELQPYWKGGGIGGDDYAKAIQCAKVNIGLLSKGNRDLHTTRSLEIPALGALLCAERTAEHLSMYREGEEALFWSDASECAAKCRYALEDEVRRAAIAKAGCKRIRTNGHYNEIILQSIINFALSCK
jgi:spore maturation protein CgeB